MRFEDLQVGSVVEGTVKNVVSYGAFVDIGLRKDGLLHISKLSGERKWIEDINEVLRRGDRIKVKILEVDPSSQRVALALVQ